MAGMVKIQGKVQHYQWGGLDYIPQLTNQPNRDASPWAEYWLGVHASAPSVLVDNGQLLSDYIQTQSLPGLQFLLKVLDVKDMLSIQVHPTPEQAKEGFARENSAGIALDAKHRNYKDDSDKPELAVALSEFWLLHGFRELSAIQRDLEEIPYLQSLLDVLLDQGLVEAFKFALDDRHPSIVAMHESLYQDVLKGDWKKNQIQFWMQRWLRDNPNARNGILTLFFLNLVKLNKGEAIFQPAGLLHAYLEGQNIELMANSDNVLRAGLTPKHIDVPELISVCCFEPSTPADYIITPVAGHCGEMIFPTPFDAFELSCIQIDASQKSGWTTESSELLLCIDGAASIQQTSGNVVNIQKGETAFIQPGTKLVIQSESCCIYRAKNLC